MRFVLAFFLLAHGVAHLVGFVSSWKLATLAELPYKTTVLSGRVDVGDAGIRVMGALWLLTGLAFLVAASAVATATDWAGRFLLAAVIASLMLCVVGWPDARIGVAVNVGLVLVLAMGAWLNLAVLSPDRLCGGLEKRRTTMWPRPEGVANHDVGVRAGTRESGHHASCRPRRTRVSLRRSSAIDRDAVGPILAGCSPPGWIPGQLPFLQDYEIGRGHD